MANAIQISGFTYKYPDGTLALNGIDLSIEHGQKVAFIGPNGAGKSTLLLALAGFAIGSGKINIDGIPLQKNNFKKIRTLIGCCMENPDDQLFMPTIFDDIAFGPLNMGLSPDEVKSRVHNALQAVGLTSMAEKAPHHLSAGQKRAAAIATILSMSPRIITFDEPDGSLDPRNRKKLSTLLKSLTQTLVIATCNMNFAADIADRTILMDAGKIIADGPTKSIMSDKNLMTSHGLESPDMISF